MIERKSNGLFFFVFGKKKDKEGKLQPHCPVEILIHGSIKMRCLSKLCGSWNIFNYFPDPITQMNNGLPNAIEAKEIITAEGGR